MKYSVKLLFTACVILSAQPAAAEVNLISKKSAKSARLTQGQNYHRYEKDIQKLDAQSSQILATLGRGRQPSSVTDAGTKSAMTVTLMKIRRK